MSKGSAILGFGAGDTLDLTVRSFAKKIKIEEVLYQPEETGDFDLLSVGGGPVLIRNHTRKRGSIINCPVCNDHTKIGIVMHSDGYADNLLECTTCETIWIANQEGTILLNNFQ